MAYDIRAHDLSIILPNETDDVGTPNSCDDSECHADWSNEFSMSIIEDRQHHIEGILLETEHLVEEVFEKLNSSTETPEAAWLKYYDAVYKMGFQETEASGGMHNYPLSIEFLLEAQVSAHEAEALAEGDGGAGSGILGDADNDGDVDIDDFFAVLDILGESTTAMLLKVLEVWNPLA